MNRVGKRPVLSEPEPEPLPMTVTLPRLAFVAQPFEDDDRAADRFAEQRVIRAGIESWQAITKAESFEGWCAIGKALAVGRDHALKVTGANRPMGKPYCRAFSEWIARHPGFATMPKSTRSVAIELVEHIDQIEAWRATLSDRERRRLIHPLSNVARWRKATAPDKIADPQTAAAIAWRRCIALAERLPADQAAPFWRNVHEQAAAVIGGTVLVT